MGKLGGMEIIGHHVQLVIEGQTRNVQHVQVPEDV